ncbi:c-type cytochrome [Parasphingopyxis marina]|uniref:C-type cytochrome n=1 Tax=Parasphingopyxis marina TaxID=2761622 RepID=A0A842I366_9SPHN|nr:c-type cytochrome [Parasphingopyxis marina]MBC2778374.1 c-type cytochrome [Parasphingopyxis marina]
MKERIAAGAAVFLLSSMAVAQPAPGDVARGERAYQKCFSCHDLATDSQPLTGPHLGGIVGRRIAAMGGFAYSLEMRAFAGQHEIWTPALLERFLADPQAVVPGNEMGFFGIGDPQERADLMAYLRAGAETR